MITSLLILIPGFAKNEEDSTCIPFSQSFIRALNRNYPELEVTIITLDFPFTTTAYRWFGNQVIPLNGTKLFRPLLWLKLYRRLKKISSQKKPTGILNLWCADNALVTHYFSKWNNITHFTWLQGQDARKDNKALWFFRPRKKNLIALSDSLKTEFEKNHAVTPAYTIYPGVDKAAFTSVHTKRDIDIIGLGSLTGLKRYDIFVDMIEKLSHVSKNIRAKIIGKGPDKEQLLQLTREKKLEKNIELVGEMEHDQVIPLLSRSKILLHPSSYEGYSIACLEALAAGCHVVSFTKAELRTVDHWHIVHSAKEMEDTCLRILQLPPEDFSPVIDHTIDSAAKKMMHLFGYPITPGVIDQPARSSITE